MVALFRAPVAISATETWTGAPDGLDINGDLPWTKVLNGEQMEILNERLVISLQNNVEAFCRARAERDVARNMVVRTDIEFESFQANMGSVHACWSSDSDTSYEGRLDNRNDTLSIAKYVNGARTSLASRAETFVDYYGVPIAVSISVLDGIITLSVEGKDDLIADDSASPLTGTRFGVGGRSRSLGSNNVYHDNVVATQLDPKPRPINVYSALNTELNPIISGGIVETKNDGYTYHTILEAGTLTVIRGGEVEYLVVGGGASGAPRNSGSGSVGSGGGGGGVLAGVMTLDVGDYPVVIGNGGEARSTSATFGAGGGSTSFAGITASGGGHGIGHGTEPTGSSGGNGSSGGGASSIAESAPGTGIVGQGHDGGTSPWGEAAGGGGGAGAPGGNATLTVGGKGGDGVEWPAASGIYYGGGGGGRGLANGAGGAGGGTAGGTPSAWARPNTGGGTGGSGNSGAANVGTGQGGSGVVIVRYLSHKSFKVSPTPYPLSGGVVTEPGDGYRYHAYYSSEEVTLYPTYQSFGVDALVVAGGGGGYGITTGSRYGPGGGAGGYVTGSMTFTGTVSVVVGLGGKGGAALGASGAGGLKGSDSSFSGLVAVGGGGTASGTGGSGGGGRLNSGGGNGTAGQGFRGGHGAQFIDGAISNDDAASGGGGGAFEAGEDGGNRYAGRGGNGITVWGFDICGGGGSGSTGFPVGRGGFGGGGDGGRNGNANNGAIGTGGGGGGAAGGAGGDGGSGIVVLRYLIP